ncbi:MAG TPA: hypothetical protein DDZ39_04615, partial [Flavobacteriaceae bacterium]|nr:hypothetical protein [Flavobacteriaceae bacterium]
DSVTLTATGGSVYLWSTGETTSSITVQPNETTVFTVEVNAEGSCGTSTDDVTVIVENLPLTINDGQDVTICKGEELVLQAKGSSNYLWNTGSMESSISVKPQETTIYTVSAQKNGELESVEITITVEECSINKKDEFKVYPNPTQGIVNIYLPSQKERMIISVISLTSGRLMFNKEVKASNRGVMTQIDLSNMLKGVYILKMSNDNFSETKKIIVN